MISRFLEHGTEKQTVDVRPDAIVLKVGRLEIEARAEAPGKAIPFVGSTVLLDGKPLPLTGVKIEGDVRGLWKITLEMWAKDAPAVS